ncbi:hypothetical protein [Erwinia phage Snitter]|nr:hypothetical protein [Erwinia phage Snitter]
MKRRVSRFWWVSVTWQPNRKHWGVYATTHDWQRLRAIWIGRICIEWYEQ